MKTAKTICLPFLVTKYALVLAVHDVPFIQGQLFLLTIIAYRNNRGGAGILGAASTNQFFRCDAVGALVLEERSGRASCRERV